MTGVVANWARLFAFGLLLASSCDRVTQVVFEVDAEREALVDAVALRVRGCTDRRQSACFQRYDEVRNLVAGILPARIPIGPPDSSAAEYAVEALLLDEEGAVLARVAATGSYTRGAILTIRRTFTADCRGLLCSALETCRNGRCLPSCEGSCRSVFDGGSCDCPCDGDVCVAGVCRPRVPLSVVAAGQKHTCAGELGTGRLWCWGQSSDGQLGIGVPADGDVFIAPSTVAIDGELASLSAGEASTCATLEPGRLWCFGTNQSGRLGRPGRAKSLVPEPTGADIGVTWLSPSIGGSHACATASMGTAFCWGRAVEGQLGVFEPPDIPTWTNTPTLAEDVVEITVGARHTCSITTSGALRCWGLNSNGQVGVSELDALIYHPVWTSTGTFLKVDAFGNASCAIRDDHRLYCWGDNTANRFGLAIGASSVVASPHAVMNADDVRLVSLGAEHQCVITITDGLQCWGANATGQLGVGDIARRLTPTDVLPEQRWMVVSAGDNHTCAVTVEGALFCWGDGLLGQLGASCGQQPRAEPCRVCLSP